MTTPLFLFSSIIFAMPTYLLSLSAPRMMRDMPMTATKYTSSSVWRDGGGAGT